MHDGSWPPGCTNGTSTVVHSATNWVRRLDPSATNESGLGPTFIFLYDFIFLFASIYSTKLYYISCFELSKKQNYK